MTATLTLSEQDIKKVIEYYLSRREKPWNVTKVSLVPHARYSDPREYCPGYVEAVVEVTT